MMKIVGLVTALLLLSCHLATAPSPLSSGSGRGSPSARRRSLAADTPRAAAASSSFVEFILQLQPMFYVPQPWDAWSGSKIHAYDGELRFKVDSSKAPMLILIEFSPYKYPNPPWGVYYTSPHAMIFSLTDRNLRQSLSRYLPFTTVASITSNDRVQEVAHYVEKEEHLKELIGPYSFQQGVYLFAFKRPGEDGGRLAVKQSSSPKRFNMAFQYDIDELMGFYGYRMFFNGLIKDTRSGLLNIGSLAVDREEKLTDIARGKEVTAHFETYGLRGWKSSHSRQKHLQATAPVGDMVVLVMTLPKTADGDIKIEKHQLEPNNLSIDNYGIQEIIAIVYPSNTNSDGKFAWMNLSPAGNPVVLEEGVSKPLLNRRKEIPACAKLTLAIAKPKSDPEQFSSIYLYYKGNGEAILSFKAWYGGKQKTYGLRFVLNGILEPSADKGSSRTHSTHRSAAASSTNGRRVSLT